MHRRLMGLLICVALILVYCPVSSADSSLEREMNAALSQSVHILEKVDRDGASQGDLEAFVALREQIQALHLLLANRFGQRGQRVAALGASANQRHAGMQQTYAAVLDTYLDLSLAIQQANAFTAQAVTGLLNSLQPLVRKKQLPIFGNLPYRHVQAAARQPDSSTSVIPAYLSNAPVSSDQDLEPSAFAPKSQAIVALAQSLDWNPARIYAWVKDNVSTQWYWGCMKGAEETLRQKSGNACDQAALLVALLRAGGYPSRYVRGVIAFFPDLAAARELVGVDSDIELIHVLQLAGIPHEVEFSGQSISKLLIEHIWVETQVPYGNYRGAVIDASGKAWVALDTSIKVDGFDIKEADPIVSQLALSPLRDLYLGQARDLSPLEYLRAEIDRQLEQNQRQSRYDDLPATRVQRSGALKILPNALQFKPATITAEYTSLPDELVHKVRFTASDANGTIFYDQSLATAALSNQQVLLTCEPESVDDQEIINGFGGLDNTPSYLIRLRPVIQVNGERRIIGRGGLASGDTFTQTITVTSPGAEQQFSNTHIMGSMAFLGIFAQLAVMPDEMAPEHKDAARLLHEVAASYAIQWQSAEDELARLLGLTLVRPLPAVVTTGGVLEVTQLLDQPHATTWKGVYVDADLRTVETAGATTMDDDTDTGTLFMRLSSLQGAFLEGRTLEDSFQVDSVSTPQLMGLATAQQGEAVRITAQNIDSLLPTLALDDAVKEDILDAVSRNLTVRSLAGPLSFEDWTGVGYIQENPETGEAGYMLSGMIAGGMTAWGADRWSEYYRNRMAYPYSAEVNDDPEAAVQIVKITATDMQLGTVGQPLEQPLQVVVRDSEGKPVAGAEVAFYVKAGGGAFDESGLARVETKSNQLGIAAAEFTLGTQTAANPSYWWAPGFIYPQQVGENIVSAVVLANNAELSIPFTEYGFPAEPAQLSLTSAHDRLLFLACNTYLNAKVMDLYGNPIANLPVNFNALEAEDRGVCLNPSTDDRQALVFDRDDDCLSDGYAIYGECASAAPSIQEITWQDGTAIVYIMGGGLIGVNYPFTATLEYEFDDPDFQLTQRLDLPDGDFGIWHHGIYTGDGRILGNCRETLPGAGAPLPDEEPAWDVIVVYTNTYDHAGNLINARPPGVTIPMKARLLFLLEEGRVAHGCSTCTEDDTNYSVCCDYMLGNMKLDYRFDVNDDKVVFDAPEIMDERWLAGYYGVDGIDQGEGFFTYDHVVQPGVNVIRIEGRFGPNASIETEQTGGATCNPMGCLPIGGTHLFGLPDGLVTVPLYTVVYGVTIDTKTQIDVAVDDAGHATCDVPIKYDIQPHEYQTANAYLAIYRAGEMISAIPTEGQGTSSASIGRGFQFDEDVSYTAEIVLNPNSSIEIKSQPITLQPATVRVERLEIVDYPVQGCLVPLGGSREIAAFTFPENRKVDWSIEGKDDGVRAWIRSIGAKRAVISADEDSESGWITVRATDEDNPCVYKEARVFIGCAKCEEGQCDNAAASGFEELGSINIGISLGPGRGGQAAGHLFIRSEEPDEKLYTPAALIYSTTTSDTEARYDEEGLLRQVMAPETLVDIQTVNATVYSLNFYRPEDVTGEQDGLYEIDPNADPFAVWSFSPYGQTGLKVSEYREGKTREHVYEWDELLGSWTLSKANGSQLLSRVEEKNGDERTVTGIIKDAYGNIASKTRTTYHTFEWGEEIVETVIDPDGAALTAATEFYIDPGQAGSYGRVAKQINADGSWTRYEYDEQGRTLTTITPWLDAGPDGQPDQARVISHSYEPVDPTDSNDDGDAHRPRTTTETITGQVVARSYFAYILDTDGTRTEISERCATVDAAYGDAANQRSVQVYYPSDTGLTESGRLQRAVHPDNRQDIYLYQSGSYSPGADNTPGLFVPGAGSDIQTLVVHGTVDHPDGIAYQSTGETTITSQLGRTLLQTSQVYTGSGYETLTWTVSVYDDNGRLTDTYTSANTHSHSDWSCCGLTSQTDAAGKVTTYSYDDLNRITTSTAEGIPAGAYPAQAAINTTHTYDALGRVLRTRVWTNDLEQTSTSTYDRAGRLTSTTGPDGLTTGYDHSPDGLTSTVTQPGGATQISTRHLDGRPQSTTGTGTTSQYYTYGVNADGSQWTQVTYNTPDGPMWQRTTIDMLGRTILAEKPGYSAIETTQNFYDAQGRLIRTSQPGRADTLYIYDELGNIIQSGLDIDANGLLEPASTDRISATDTRYMQLNGQWWQQTVQQVYPTDNDGTPLTVATQRSQITGLIADNELGESVSIDIHGNAVTSRGTGDRAAKTITQTIDYPDSDINAETISVNGRVMQSRSKTGLVTSLIYDSLGRRTGVTDPRTGTATTHYDVLGRVESIDDAAGNTTLFGYDDQTGRKISQTDALGKITRYAYNSQGQVTRTWGDAAYPISYSYDAYGRMNTMTTFRSDQGFAGETFPENAAGDTTTWLFDEATGLLEAKQYADASQVGYTYTTAGRLDTRAWARQDSGQPLTTTYSYDPATGELILIDYPDSTPDISFTYDRLGRQSEISDALGTRTIGYNPALQPESETTTGLYNTTLLRSYAATGVIGRNTGFTLDGAYAVTYGYDATGRFENLSWNADGQTGQGAFAYLPDSNLLQSFTTASGLQTTYSYEPQRNLKTRVQNNVNAGTVSQYDYVYDPVGRRTSAANSGSAFAQAAYSSYGYNDRSELNSANRYLGSDILDTSNPVPAEQRAYLYDPIGNRTQAEAAGVTTGYTANEVNQYNAITGPVAGSPTYDPDGNMVSDHKGMSYTYNAENRLVTAEPATPVEGSTRLEFIYDYMGRRVQKLVSTYTSGTWEPTREDLFVYDGWNLIRQTSTPTGQSGVDTCYVWGLDLSQSLQGAGGVGGLVAKVEGSLTYHYLYDANGNVGQLVDVSDGSLAAHYEYDPYGNVIVAVGPMAEVNAYRFSTKYFDQDTKLYYYGYRYYSAELGRWINKDPIGENGGTNLYSFVGNNTYNFIDRFGRTEYDLQLRRQGKQIPKAVGISGGWLFSALLANKGISAGYQVGTYFFPDTCEIATFQIKAGKLREKEKMEDPSSLYDGLDWKYRNKKYRDYTALFEEPSQKPIEPNPYPFLDQLKSIFGDKGVDNIIDEASEGFGENGIYLGIGLNIEYAKFIGYNKNAGAAKAQSFKGIFHTIEVALKKSSASAYVGAARLTNGNWMGGTYGAYGYGNGIATVDWEYQEPKIIDLDKDDSFIGTCICEEFIRKVPPMP